VTPSVSSQGASDASGASKGLVESSPSVCTPVCTSQTSPPQTDPVAALAAALMGLSAADRARLAAMLIGQQTGQPKGSGEAATGPCRPG
jgi:hypothetical protein